MKKIIKIMKKLTILASNKNKNPPVPQKIQELQELLQDFTGFTGFYRNCRIYRSLQESQERGMPGLHLTQIIKICPEMGSLTLKTLEKVHLLMIW